ncbi:MAG TPA: chemotaxis protein CheW [Pyrinomonadaceae bacterium]|nr:chemotaxis protein CheW [Pyrinomonadaceae bacterium]
MSEYEEKYEGTTTRDKARAVLMLRAGGLAFAVYAEECECVTPWAEPAPLPHAPASVLGVASVRGRMRTVLDPARLLETSGLSYERRDAAHSFVASLKGDEQLALACESSEPLTLHAEHISPAESPVFPARGSFRHGGETVHLLDPARLFDAAMSGTERRRQRAVNSE